MLVHEFQAKWRGAMLKERSASQEHFIDLCRVLGMPTPAEADKTGSFYTFEKGATKTSGGKGFADVWWRGRFGWEYKGNRADLNAAYQQLLQYREDLDNPPLLVVCDLDRFEVHTNFTGTAKRVYAFAMVDLDRPDPVEPGSLAALDILRAVFSEPERLQPGQTAEAVTQEAARHFGELAQALNARGVDPHRAAHFLMQLLFCMFAEDVGLLTKGLFSKVLAFGASYPEQFPPQATLLFSAMRDGGFFNMEPITRFNGGLFAEIHIEPLSGAELGQLAAASRLDWASVEPAIFGTLFERSLDPGKRAQLGAHYTGRRDIERVVEPVVIAPLRRRWDTVRVQPDQIVAKVIEQQNLVSYYTSEEVDRNRRSRALTRAASLRNDIASVLRAFQDELAALRILDPACGSGNFLYVALAALKDLEKEVGLYGAANGLPMMLPRVSPSQLYGLEINQYAQELAQVVVWIGYLQWMTANGFQPRRDPVLEPLDTIRLQDALLDRSDPAHPQEATWPEADVIIGNPPFLGGNKVRQELGDAYVEDLFKVYDGRVLRFADLVCYFFEKARGQIDQRGTKRAGLLATNSIRGGANRKVLERIKESGDIFMAWSDEPWIINGAAVRISIVGFDGGVEHHRKLDGNKVITINPDLTSTADITIAMRMVENAGIAFTGIKKTGSFDIPGELARKWLSLPLNPNGRPNSDVIRPIANGIDITRRPRDVWIVDFGVDMPEGQAAFYEAPYEYVREHVKPERAGNRVPQLAERWWLHARSRPEMREAFKGLHRYLATPAVAKHRLFAWFDLAVLPDHQLNVFARDDDYFFGVLHSRAHEVWSLRMGTSLEDRPRYTPMTCFETFPFPHPDDAQREEIGAAAKVLDDLRRNWLNPEGADAATLKKRTLTNLYNERPTWLANVHARLDRAVWSAYGWPEDPSATDDETILARLLALNLG